MSNVIRYKVKPAFAAENEELIRAVFEELHRADPGNVRYASFVQDDGVSFVHVVDHDPAEGSNPLLALAAFKRFQEGIAERCEVPPAFTSMREVGSYGNGSPESRPDRVGA